MADTHDTIKGLLAEFRGYSAGMPASYHVTMSWADFRKMLDRFDAAHKRERGNAAKLREAVKAVVDVGYPHNFQVEAPHIRGYCYDITRAIEKCFAALAAKPRNCDLYSSATAAWLDWSSKNILSGGTTTLDRFLVWLFARAQEGGAK